MAPIKSASRTAAVAFCPEAPLLAAGTMAGAIDLSFSSSTSLEIFKLDFQSQDPDLPVVRECPTNERFMRLSWSRPIGDHGLGLIAGSLVDGSIGVWNPAALVNGEDVEGSLLSRLQRHTVPVRGLEFNPFNQQLLASGADDGELCIWDLTNPRAATHFPPLKGVGASALGEVSYLSWNRKHHNIVASTSYNGTTVVWDLNRQKPIISFPDTTRRRCSVLQWNPDMSTQLIIASDDDNSPSLRVWDVRNTISPAREFVGHSKGVLAMSWCPNDSSFLLTCAKDNRTICWDTSSGEILCEIPPGSNWNFDVQWSPKIRGVLSTSSFDGRIGIYNIEACSRNVTVNEFGGVAASGISAPLKAPKWMKRPVGVSFGFGGKLATFKPSPAAQNSSSRQSEAYIHTIVSEDSMVARSTEFEAAIADGEKASMRSLCEKKAEESRSDDERETWNFLKVMFEDEGTARTKLLEHLGFEVPAVENDNAAEVPSSEFDPNSIHFSEKLRLDEKDELSLSHDDNEDDFFEKLQSPKVSTLLAADSFDEQQQEPTAMNGEGVEHEKDEKTNYSELNKAIQHSLVVGDYKGAVSQCLAANRPADALIIANLGGGSLWDKTRDEYLNSVSCQYLKVVSAMVRNDLSVLVKSRPLELWKETLALLCTYSQREEWTDLCDALAARLTLAGNTLAATLCYICAGNIDKTVEIWSKNLKSNQEGRSFVDKLQDLMEKTVILALATGQKQVSPTLSKLVESYIELLASQGLLTTAMEYIKLLGSEDSSQDLAILRERVFVSGSEGKEASAISEPRDIQTEAQYNNFGMQDQWNQNPQINLNQGQQFGYTGTYSDNANVSYERNYQLGQPQAPQAPIYSNFSNQQFFQPQQQPQPMHQQPQLVHQQQPLMHQQHPQTNFSTPASQQTVKTFNPASLPNVKNVEQYQLPARTQNPYQGGPSAPPVPHPLATPAPTPPVGNLTQPPFGQHVLVPGPASQATTPRGFAQPPSNAMNFRPDVNPPMPQTPTQAVQTQTVAPPASPPPTVQTADTSNVSAELKPVIKTLTRLFNETSQAPGVGRQKREIEDISRKIGTLFAKLNSGDISSNVASKLIVLCQALDTGDYERANNTLVALTTSDWDECSFWHFSLKRMIKGRTGAR